MNLKNLSSFAMATIIMFLFVALLYIMAFVVYVKAHDLGLEWGRKGADKYYSKKWNDYYYEYWDLYWQRRFTERIKNYKGKEYK